MTTNINCWITESDSDIYVYSCDCMTFDDRSVIYVAFVIECKDIL